MERISHYRIVAKVGKGAMGEVYRAVDERLGRSVALKLLPRDRAASSDLQARMLREAQAASALNHPGIVTVHDIGAWKGQLYIVMELVDGESFSDLAKGRGAGGRVSVDEALRLIAQAADALGVAHASGIFHRDVKSDNLMRTRDGRVKVLDFGLAKSSAGSGAARPEDAFPTEASQPGVPPESTALAETLVPASQPSQPSTLPSQSDTGANTPAPSAGSDVTNAGALVGTPAYMSPEQTRGRPADACSEVFSLGVVLYELLVGKRPFDRETVQDTMVAVGSAKVGPPSAAAPDRGISERVDRVALRALSRAREGRYVDMAAFASALREAMSAPRAEERDATSRRRALRIGVAIAGVAIAGGAAAFVALRKPDRAAETVVRSTRRLTYDPGCEEYPSFSPDGKSVVYDGLVDGDYEILKLELASMRRVRLTQRKGWDYGPASAPDGRSVAFLHQTERGVELNVLALDGEEAASPRALGFVRSYPAWSPDGALFAGDEQGNLLRWAPGSDAPEIYARTRPGWLLRYVAPFSDGNVYAILREASRERDEVLGVLGKGVEPRVIERDVTGTQSGMVASERNSALYYLRAHGSNTELMRMDHPSGTSAPVPGNLTVSGGFDVSDDGTKLVYSTCREFRFLARVRRPLPGRPPAPSEELLLRSEWDDVSPAVAGDGHVLFTSDRSGQWQVWVYDLASGTARAFSGPDTADGAASLDRKWVVYVSRSSSPGLRIVPWDGGPERAITSVKEDARPRFTHDGKHVVFQRTTPEGVRVFLVSVEGGEARPISPVGASDPIASPVEDRIVFLVPREGGAQPMFTDSSGATATPVPGIEPGTFTSARFSPDGKRLLLVRKATELVELALDGSAPPEVVWKTELDGVAGAEYAPDGDGFIVTSGAWDGDLWLAEGKFF